jgi:hypothetical protein
MYFMIYLLKVGCKILRESSVAAYRVLCMNHLSERGYKILRGRIVKRMYCVTSLSERGCKVLRERSAVACRMYCIA